ncbi:MAG: hypothetical protein IPK76_25205 [Lewinellaceae bacterium]|nr:hypothetical protein [Lewinellaceae bacterium]
MPAVVDGAVVGQGIFPRTYPVEDQFAGFEDDQFCIAFNSDRMHFHCFVDNRIREGRRRGIGNHHIIKNIRDSVKRPVARDIPVNRSSGRSAFPGILDLRLHAGHG